MRPYSLSLYASILDPAGQGFIAGLTKPAADWRRTISAAGGYAEGAFSLGEGPGISLFDAFGNWLGCHLVEKTGGVTTWEGMVYELELWHQGIRRIRTLELMANAVRASYTAYTWQPGGGWTWQNRWTSWATNAQSAALYGRREQVLELDACPYATAEAKRDTTLATFAWPWARAIGSTSELRESRSVSGVGEATTRLIVRAAGYIATASWMLAAEGDHYDHDVSHWIAAIVGAAFGLSANHGGTTAGAGDCQFLKAGAIETNTLQVTEATTTPQRAGDLLMALAGLGDATGRPWTLQAGPGRTVGYKALDATPRYYIRRGAVYDSLAAGTPTPPWTLRPAVIRDMSYRPPARSEPGSFLSDPRDIYVEVVEVRAGGRVSLRTSLFDKSSLLANQFDYLEPGWGRPPR